MKILKTLAVLLALSGLPAWALQDSSRVVQVEAYPSLKPVHPDALFTVAVRLRIQKGWHVNAHEGLPDYFIPLELSLPAGGDFSASGEVRYPAGEKKALGGSAKAFPVYEGDQVLYLDIRSAPSAKPGSAVLPLSLKLQACNDKVCLSPATVPVTVQVQVGDLKAPVAPFHPELFQGALASQPASGLSENIIAKYLRNNGILLTFVLIFLGGLALNLTPCVYPMIPLTISYFGNQKAEKPGVILGRAVAYVVGISITYSSLGVTAALTGKILGSSLQSPAVLVGISLVLVVLSFSMFGLYEIQAPAWLLNKIASSSTQGWLGALGMGLVFGIVAAPCVDPFSIGLLTFVAAKANPYLGFIMFFTLSLGLGFPYVWLGFFSTEIQRLPRSGMWMVWVKKIFGMVLLGMPLYFLSPLLPKGWEHFLVPAYLVLGGLLLGWVFSGKGVTEGFKRFQWVFGAVLLALGIVVFQAWPQPVELPFAAYDPATLTRAEKDGKPVFIDFSASWCAPCKELEIKTFSNPKVHEALKGWVLLKADLTQFSSGPVEELKRTYGIMGVPTLVFVGKDGKEKKDLRAVGFINVEEMLQKTAHIGD
ncbi:MAG TPA: cytochrome c biogenesis protein CcdA [bacterium]|nr:cytochrome c biogenesis protein CcdA [bacterium]